MDKLSQQIKKIFYKNFFNLSMNQGANILVTLIVTPILFQNLGDSNFGLINLCLSIISILNIVVSYGFHLNGPKRVAILKNNKVKLSYQVNQIIIIRFFLACFICIIFYFISITFDLFSSYRIILLFALICLFREALLPDFYLQGTDNIFYTAFTNSISKIVYLILIVLMIKGPEDSYLVYFYFGISSVFVSSIYWANLFFKNKLVLISISLLKTYKNLKENFKFFLSSIAGHISLHGAILILTNFVQNSELGKFALAHRIAFLARMIPTFFVQSILQKASIMKDNKNASFLKETLNRYYLIGILITIISAFFIIIFSNYIIYILSGEFIPLSKKLLEILSFIPFLGMLNFKNMIYILINEKQDLLYKATWITTVFMLFICTIGCIYYGSIGLAYSLLITEMFSFIIHSLFIKKFK